MRKIAGRSLLVLGVAGCLLPIVPGIPFLIAGAARLWELLVLLAVFGVAGGVFYPAATGLVPLTVGPELLQQANALRGLSQSAGIVAGPALAGVVIASASPGWAVAADAGDHNLRRLADVDRHTLAIDQLGALRAHA